MLVSLQAGPPGRAAGVQVPADLSRAVSAVASASHRGVSVNAAESEDIRPLIMYLEDPTYIDTTYQVRSPPSRVPASLWSRDAVLDRVA